jgi:hypothetical protein
MDRRGIKESKTRQASGWPLFLRRCYRGLSARYTGMTFWRRARDHPAARATVATLKSDPQIALLSMLFLSGGVFPLVKSAAQRGLGLISEVAN